MNIGYPDRRYVPRHAAPYPTWARTGHWFTRRFGGLAPHYWLLLASAGVFRLGFVVVPFRAFYLSHERHLSATAASLVMVGFGLGWAASQPIGGVLADRYGRRVVITAGALGSAMAFLAFGTAHSFTALAVTACAAGATFDLYRPALQALTTDLVPEPGQRRKALALLYLCLNAGRGAACLLGGLLATQAFWHLFVLNAAVNVAFGLAVYRTIPQTRPAGRRQATGQLRVALRDRPLLWFTGITVVFYVVHMQSVIVLPLVIAQSGASPLQFGMLLALDPLIVAVVQLGLQHKLLNATALRACATGVAIVGIGLAIAGAGSGIGWFAATMPLWIAGEVIFLAVAQDVVASFAPPHLTGSYFGLWGLSQGIAALLAPLLATVAIGLAGTRLLWATGVILAIAAAAACLRLHHQQQRRHTHTLQLILAPTR
jgi:MFS family permease